MAKASYFNSYFENMTVGNEYHVKVYSYDSTHLHKIVIKCGDYSMTLNRVKGEVETKFTIPMEWANAFPNSTSLNGTITLATYQSNYSTTVGSSRVSTVTFNLAATAGMPKLSVEVTDIDPSITDKFGSFVQIKSKLNVVITATGQYGATIKTYKTTLNGATYSKESFTTNALNYNGHYTMVTTVVDSRGKAMTTTTDIEILPYNHPRIVGFSTFRSDASGNASPNGAYLTAKVNVAISGLNGQNSSSYFVEYKKKSDTMWSILESGTGYSINKNIVSSGAILNTNSSYDTRLVIIDDFKEVEAIGSIGTAFKLVHYNKNGKAMGFGKLSEKDEGIEFGIPTYFDRAPVFLAEEKILWSGAIPMTGDQRADLSLKVSEQVNGIVLVFSHIDGDYQFNSFFIPKEFINNHRGEGSQFIMMGGVFETLACKYLYVNETYITGHNNNAVAGTRNGITYDNSKFVLRYILGV